jgi:hypothetical protein
MIISGYFLRISLFTIRRAGMKAGRKDGFLELFLFLLSGLFCFISSELVDAESEVPMEKLLQPSSGGKMLRSFVRMNSSISASKASNERKRKRFNSVSEHFRD